MEQAQELTIDNSQTGEMTDRQAHDLKSSYASKPHPPPIRNPSSQQLARVQKSESSTKIDRISPIHETLRDKRKKLSSAVVRDHRPVSIVQQQLASIDQANPNQSPRGSKPNNFPARKDRVRTAVNRQLPPRLQSGRRQNAFSGRVPRQFSTQRSSFTQNTSIQPSNVPAFVQQPSRLALLGPIAQDDSKSGLTHSTAEQGASLLAHAKSSGNIKGGAPSKPPPGNIYSTNHEGRTYNSLRNFHDTVGKNSTILCESQDQTALHF